MALSSDLLSQFAKITNDNKKTIEETTVYGTAVEYNGGTYVRLDGSELLTPITTTATVKAGERVTVMIKNHTATVTGNLSSPSARINDVNEIAGDVVEFNTVLANKVDTLEFNAERARINTLVVDNATIKNKLAANEAEITNIQTVNVNVTGKITAVEADVDILRASKLDANVANITYAKITDLEATNAAIGILDANLAKIDTLMFGAASGNVIHTSFSNSVIAQLGDAQIKSAMIESVTASKITAGDIITNNVRVMSEDGALVISDETIQIRDSRRVRVQIGKDAVDDYSISIWDQEGNLMFSEGGITDSAIKTSIIRDDMVSDTANISAHKLDIDSLFEEINGSTNTIKSTKVYFDDESQTLDIAFKMLESDVDGLNDSVASYGTQLSIIQGHIDSKIWEQDIESATGELSTKYSTLEQELTGFKTTVSETVSNVDDLGVRMSSVEQTTTGITAQLIDISTDIGAAARTATDYLNLSSAGLVVGQNPSSPTAGNTLIETDGVTIRKGTTVLAAFKAATRTASGVSSAILTSTDSLDSESDGVTKVSGTVTSGGSRANVYITTNGNPVYFPKGLETDKVLINNESGIISNANILLNGSLVDKSGEGILTPLNSYGNMVIGYGRYQDGGYTHVYGTRVKAKTKTGFSASVNGSAALDTNNEYGNATFGWHLYNADKGETNIYGKIASLFAKDDIRLNANGNSVRMNGDLIPYETNMFNIGSPSLAMHNIYIGSTNTGSYHGIRYANASGETYNAVGVNANGYVVFGNTTYCTNLICKSTTTDSTGYSFKITCGDNPALVLGDNDARLLLFGGTDSTSRYIGSCAAYKRTYSASANMVITENSIIGRATSSSRRYKHDISIVDIDDVKGLYDIPVKKFKYNKNYLAETDELYDKHLYGFIVEDFEDVLPCAVQHMTDENGNTVPEMWNSNIIVPVLLKLIQDLNERLKNIEQGELYDG